MKKLKDPIRNLNKYLINNIPYIEISNLSVWTYLKGNLMYIPQSTCIASVKYIGSWVECLFHEDGIW